jgi:DNA-binding transcriptional regulator YiaG
MPNIAKVLKDEVSRLARRETNKALASISKPALGLRRTTADLKRRVAQLEKELRSLRKTIDGLAKAHPAAVPETTDKARITANGMGSLRRRLRLTGQEFARLLGITSQVVYRWEKASGPLRVRGTTRAAILAVRSIGAREARRRLEQMQGTKKPAKTAPRRRRRVPKGTT